MLPTKTKLHQLHESQDQEPSLGGPAAITNIITEDTTLEIHTYRCNSSSRSPKTWHQSQSEEKQEKVYSSKPITTELTEQKLPRSRESKKKVMSKFEICSMFQKKSTPGVATSRLRTIALLAAHYVLNRILRSSFLHSRLNILHVTVR